MKIKKRLRNDRGHIQGYIVGIVAASNYIGFRDKQGRTFSIWARKMRIPYAEIGGSICYAIEDLDAAWARAKEKTTLP